MLRTDAASPPPGRLTWLLPFAGALLLFLIGISIALFWRQIDRVAPRLSLPQENLRGIHVALAGGEVLLAWRISARLRAARRLHRAARSGAREVALQSLAANGTPLESISKGKTSRERPLD